MYKSHSDFYKNLTLLVTGPIDAFWFNSEIIPNIELFGIRAVLSTWNGQSQLADLNSSELLTITTLDDVGSRFGYEEGGSKKYLNISRQHALYKLGLASVSSEYCLRIRADITLDFSKIHKLIDKVNSGLIVSVDISSVSPLRPFGEKTQFHPCDWLFFATTEMHRLMIIADVDESTLLLPKPIEIAERTVFSKISAEQSFVLNIMSEPLVLIESPLSINMPQPTAAVDFGFWVIAPAEIGLRSSKYSLRIRRLRRIYSDENYRFKRFPHKLEFFKDALFVAVKIVLLRLKKCIKR